ncbi:dispanin subfamily A member 2b-like [Chiloscyllium plagiosum]|uniref:dispanin subfamily A member 2b-like n=1 Tax=Chiloscyllium plagiosum TaxID=36176 RepID=UPI001CB80EEF|nr:dispanin subfamily A member 2b-like [Chiloscyllium plagiosum]
MEGKVNQPMIERELDRFRGPHSSDDVPSTVVTIGTGTAPISDHVLWSLFNFVHCNFCCLGFLALVFSVKSRDRKTVGDVATAEHYSSTSKSLNIATTSLSILTFVILFGLLVAGVIQIPRY